MEKLKKIIKTTYKHFVVAFVVQAILMLGLELFNVDMNIVSLEQALLFAVIWFVGGWLYEIRQKNTGGNNTRLQMLQDAVMTALGGFLAVILFNLIF